MAIDTIESDQGRVASQSGEQFLRVLRLCPHAVETRQQVLIVPIEPFRIGNDDVGARRAQILGPGMLQHQVQVHLGGSSGSFSPRADACHPAAQQ